MTKSFEWANEAEQVKAVIITGKGNFFSSGMELNALADEIAKGNVENLENLTEAFR